MVIGDVLLVHYKDLEEVRKTSLVSAIATPGKDHITRLETQVT